ncbi:heavy-metal-associated domain-containing protein, partial [Candidatus Roizmanbacteria bacterium]|nr:heavy-metal-associated domain-containing protein [Candidatus Roizmanbacteria bacterium]
MTKPKKTTLHIQGMHCPSCDILISDKCRELENVKAVKADYRKRTAEIFYTGKIGRDQIDEINRKIRPFGYKVGVKTMNYELRT